MRALCISRGALATHSMGSSSAGPLANITHAAAAWAWQEPASMTAIDGRAGGKVAKAMRQARQLR